MSCAQNMIFRAPNTMFRAPNTIFRAPNGVFRARSGAFGAPKIPRSALHKALRAPNPPASALQATSSAPEAPAEGPPRCPRNLPPASPAPTRGPPCGPFGSACSPPITLASGLYFEELRREGDGGPPARGRVQQGYAAPPAEGVRECGGGQGEGRPPPHSRASGPSRRGRTSLPLRLQSDDPPRIRSTPTNRGQCDRDALPRSANTA
jgi:hypothetical protein